MTSHFHKILTTLTIILSFSSGLWAQMVKGYFPYYRSVAQANAVNYSQLTDVIYAFASIDANGNLAIMTPATFNAVKTQCDANGVRLWVAIGGWGLSGNFPGVAADAGRRANLANQCLNLCTTYGLAGIDIDWEFPGAGDAANYTAMLAAIKGAIGPTYKLSAALGGESFTYSCVNQGHAVGVQAAAFTHLDFFNIMSYDAPACFANHTSLDFMQRSMDGWYAKGCPYEKMIPGIAFYGRCAAVVEYNVFSNAAPATYFNDADGIYGGYCYDSKPTIEAKVNWAMCTKGAPGVMVWELSQDRSDAYALLPVMKSAADACACPFSDPDLGPDVSLCGVSSVTLNSGIATNAPSRTFTWKRNGSNVVTNSTTATTYNATTGGTYEVIITEGTCTKSDQIVVSSTLPTPNLGSDFNLCNPASVTLSPSNLGSFPGGTTWQWSYAGSPLTGATSSSLTNVRRAGLYRLTASVSGCASTFDEITLTSSLPTPVDGCTNSSGTVNLSVTNPGLGAGPYNWYDAATGGSVLHTGTSYSPNVATTKTFYVQEGAGVAGSVGGAGAFGAPDWSGTITNKKMDFTTSVGGVTFTSVDVYVQEWASVTGLVVTIETSGGTVIGSTSPVSYDNGASGSPYRLVINTSSIPALSSAGTYRIYFSAGSGTPRYSSAGYPITEGTGAVTITGGTRYFTNIQFVAGSACARLPVIATVGGCGSLPVNFESFSAQEISGDVLLTWNTSWELLNDYFEVQRSEDGLAFSSIGVVNGSGTTNANNRYSFTDSENGSGTLYYRIAQVDEDGSISYSSIVTVQKVQGQVSVSPNPFSSHTFVTGLSLNQNGIIKIYDLTGNLVESKEVKVMEDIMVGEELSEGAYILQIISNEESYTQRIIKIE